MLISEPAGIFWLVQRIVGDEPTTIRLELAGDVTLIVGVVVVAGGGGGGGGVEVELVTVKLNEAWCVCAPAVPVTTIVYGPDGVVALD